MLREELKKNASFDNFTTHIAMKYINKGIPLEQAHKIHIDCAPNNEKACHLYKAIFDEVEHKITSFKEKDI